MDESIHNFISFDGTKLEGVMSVPSQGSRPLVILVHGITSNRDELGLYSGLAEHLAEKGLTCFRFDYRCHGVNSEAIENMTLAGIINDIEAACSYSSILLQPTWIHAIGMSFGGGLTAFWAATTQIPVKSIVLLAPVIDYQEDIVGQHNLIEDNLLSQPARKELATKGHLITDGIQYGRSLLNEIPHINGIVGLKRLKCKSLILHGDADSIVPYESSVSFARLNKKCKLVNVPGTDHGFGIPGDEDLTSPDTKAHHAKVFEIISGFIHLEE